MDGQVLVAQLEQLCMYKLVVDCSMEVPPVCSWPLHSGEFPNSQEAI